MTSHLYIPDPHAEPEVSNERFDLLGSFIIDHKPDVIVCAGDLADMPSLSSYDKGKKSFEGRRYSEDIAVVQDAITRMFAPTAAYNAIQAKRRDKQYKPRLVMTLGNHEARISRAVQMSPELEGTIGLSDLGYEEAGFEVYPYLQPVEIDGLFYNHFFVSGVRGEAIGGVNPAKAMLMKHMASCTAGHSHTMDFATAVSPNGRRVFGLVAGCFCEQPMAYAHATQYQWWAGLVLKHNVKDGSYDPDFFSMNRLRELYGFVR